MNFARKIILFIFLLVATVTKAQMHQQWAADMGVNKFSQYLGGTTYRYFSSAVQYKLVSNLEGKTYLPYTEIIDETSYGGKLTNLAMLGVNTRFGVRTSGPDISWSYNIGLGNPQNSNGSGVAVSKYRGLTVAFVNFTRFSFSSNPTYNAIGITLPGGQKLMFNPSGSQRLSSIAIDDSANTYLAINWGEVDCIDSTGALKWRTTFSVRSFTGSTGDILIKTDNAGYVYVLYASNTSGTNFFNGVRDSFPYTTWFRMHKLRASDGSRVWTKAVPCSSIDFDVLNNGRSLCFSGTMRDPSGSYTSISFDGITVYQQYGSNAYLAFMDSSGNYYKAFNVPVVPSCFAMGPLGNIVYLGGTCKDSTYLPGQSVYSSKRSVFVIAYDSSGNHKWNMMDSTYYPVLSSMQSVAADTSGRIYTAITLNNFYFVDPLCNQADSVIRLVAYHSLPVSIQKPSQATTGAYVKKSGPTSAELRWTNGNGNYRLVIARESNPVTQSPLDASSYNPNNIFGLGSNLGGGNYVVYGGVDSFLQVKGLKPRTIYYFKIYEYNGCGASTKYAAQADSLMIQTASPHYYTKTSGFINDLATWGDSTTGGGTAPFSFEGDSITWHVVNNTMVSMQPVGLSIIGAACYVIIGDSINPVNFVVPDSALFTAGHLRITPNATFTVMGSCSTTNQCYGDSLSLIYLLDANSIKAFGVMTSCYNLKIKSNKRIVTSTTLLVRNRFSMGGDIIGDIVLGTDTGNRGQLDYIKGTVYGTFHKYFSKVLTAGNEELFPVGYKEGPGFSVFRSRHMRIRYNQAPTVGGLIQVSVGPKSPYTTYSGLPLTDTSGGSMVTINKVGYTIWTVQTGISGGQFSIIVTDTNPRGDSVAALRLLRIWHPMYGPPFQIVQKSGYFRGNSGTSFNPVVCSHNLMPDWYNGWAGIVTEFVSGIDTNSFSLPVTWLSFTAQGRQQNVHLNWTTASEINNSHFEIERSADGKKFEFAGRVEGNGTTTHINSYKFVDAGAFAKANSDVLYYRLKQVDFNGDFAYSEIRVVRQNEVEVKQTVTVYPNPFKDELYVQLNNADTGSEIRLMDITGKVWHAQTGKVGEQSIQVSKLPAGVYFLQVVNNERTTTKKIVKAY